MPTLKLYAPSIRLSMMVIPRQILSLASVFALTSLLLEKSCTIAMFVSPVLMAVFYTRLSKVLLGYAVIQVKQHEMPSTTAPKLQIRVLGELKFLTGSNGFQRGMTSVLLNCLRMDSI